MKKGGTRRIGKCKSRRRKTKRCYAMIFTTLLVSVNWRNCNSNFNNSYSYAKFPIGKPEAEGGKAVTARGGVSWQSSIVMSGVNGTLEYDRIMIWFYLRITEASLRTISE